MSLQPGDRVTSPLLNGEWQVQRVWGNDAQAEVVWMSSDTTAQRAFARVMVSDLTPVAPPLPPEPAVGSVVRAHGLIWQRGDDCWQSARRSTAQWPGLATAPDLSPVVAVDDATRWLELHVPEGVDEAFHAEFGGWDK